MGTYDVAQICMNGHCVNSDYNILPELRAAYCSKCGAETIIKCPSCGADIRGYYDVPGAIASVSSDNVPAHCHQCGEAYPWTAAQLDAAKEYVRMLEEFTDEEKEQVEQVLIDISQDGPRAEAGAKKLLLFLRKLKDDVAAGLRELAIQIAAETVKRMLTP